MTSNASTDSDIDSSELVPPDPWSADWTVPARDDLESRHESVRRHQKEGGIPSRLVGEVQRRANRRVNSGADRRTDAQADLRADVEADRRADVEPERRADAQGDRRVSTEVDQEWIPTFGRDLEDGPAESA